MPSLSKARLLSGPGDGICGVREFVYRGVEGHDADGGAALPNLPANIETLWCETPIQDPPEPEKKYTEEELTTREQRAWERGAQETAAQTRRDMEIGLTAEREKLTAALDEFVRERNEYFRNVEAEVVRLVLTVARKVLHREAQVDPLLLTGVVRVALDQIANGTGVKLRVPAIQADAWRAAVESIPDRSSAIEVVGDNSLEGPDCLIVTEAGTTDISLEAQLAEIERGFMDLLSQRPAHDSRELHAPSCVA